MNQQEGKYEKIAIQIGSLVDRKNQAYGNSINNTERILKVFLEHYSNNDGTYTIPEEMIDVIARQARVIDKQARIFSNPKGDLMDEDPNKDIAGYSIIAYAAKEDKNEKKANI